LALARAAALLASRQERQAFEEHDVGFVFEERAGEGRDEFGWIALL